MLFISLLSRECGWGIPPFRHARICSWNSSSHQHVGWVVEWLAISRTCQKRKILPQCTIKHIAVLESHPYPRSSSRDSGWSFSPHLSHWIQLTLSLQKTIQVLLYISFSLWKQKRSQTIKRRGESFFFLVEDKKMISLLFASAELQPCLYLCEMQFDEIFFVTVSKRTCFSGVLPEIGLGCCFCTAINAAWASSLVPLSICNSSVCFQTFSRNLDSLK